MIEKMALGSFGMDIIIETDPNKIYPAQAGTWPVPDLSEVDKLPIDVRKPDGTWATIEGDSYAGTKVYYEIKEADTIDKFDLIGEYEIVFNYVKVGVYGIIGTAARIKIDHKENIKSP